MTSGKTAEPAEGPKPRRRAPRQTAADRVTLLTDDDLHLFNEGSHFHLFEKLGSHLVTAGDAAGCYFAVFAPNAEYVSVIGDFNGWDKGSHPLRARASSGLWEGFVPGVDAGARYKYHVASRYAGYRVDKADPFAFAQERPPATGSVVAAVDFVWNDTVWMEERGGKQKASSPMSIYEVHLGSWRRVPEENHRPLTYREAAPQLADYARAMGYTHVELMPIMEHPFHGSWGYQVTGYFAPTARYGTPEDFQYLVDHLHRQGIGVILDWVPSHFPTDEHGLGYFDGTHLFEHADPRQGFHPDWKSSIFNYGRNEIRSFLFSSAVFWLEKYHADGLRVDGVASMLYLDYSRKAGEWIANEYGGRENLGAISFLRRLNEHVDRAMPEVVTIAEESTAWPMVSRPTHLGGLGFRMKWDLGWMNDTLEYMEYDPVHRKYHHDLLTFRPIYAGSENFVLPLSHDEVVHMKGSLLGKMPGDEWQKFANLRLLLAYQGAVPGKKLLFMGDEFGQWAEWDHDASLQWHLLERPLHAGAQRLAADLNRLHASEPPLHERDFDTRGFEWVDCHDFNHSVITLLRFGHEPGRSILAAFNFTPVPRYRYRVGVPFPGRWTEILNTDALDYGGSGVGNSGSAETQPVDAHGRPCSLELTLPPLAAVFFRSPEPTGVRSDSAPRPDPLPGGEAEGPV